MGRQKEKNYSKSVMNDIRLAGSNAGRVSHRGNVTPASSGRVDGPAACKARRGPDGVRVVVDFCEPAKIHDIPGLPTGDIPSREQPAGRKTGDIPSREQPAGRKTSDIPSRGRAADGERNPKIVRSALLGVSLNTSRADFSEYIKKPSQMLLKGLFKKLR